MKEEKIKVLALLPMELPKEIDLDNTLEAMQKFVGGLIECITLSDTGSEVTLVCNDEGKLLGLPLNRPLPCRRVQWISTKRNSELLSLKSKEDRL